MLEQLDATTQLRLDETREIMPAFGWLNCFKLEEFPRLDETVLYKFGFTVSLATTYFPGTVMTYGNRGNEGRRRSLRCHDTLERLKPPQVRYHVQNSPLNRPGANFVYRTVCVMFLCPR